MEKKISIYGHSLKWGLILGITLIIVSLIEWILNILPTHLIIILLMSIIPLTIIVVLILIGTKKYRDTILNGKIDFGKAFASGFLIIIFASILTGLFGVVFSRRIGPLYVEKTVEATKEWTYEFMVRHHVPETMIDKYMERFNEETEPAGLNTFISSIIWNALLGAVICLIIAAVVKREDKTKFANHT